MTQDKTFTKNVENIEDKKGEITAALSTVVFALASESHRRVVRSATYAGTYSLTKK